MRCTNGHDNPPDVKFCGQCGERIGFGSPNEDSSSEVAHESPPPSLQEPTGTGPAEKSNAKWVIGAVLAALLVVGIVVMANGDSNDDPKAVSQATVADGSSSGTPIDDAAVRCGLTASVGDNGSSITLDTEGEEDFSGHEVSDVACLLNALDTPDHVISRMDQTRALDGTLDASWGDYEAFWNYHPDSGMNLTVFEAE